MQIGKIYEHILSKDYVMVIEKGKEQYRIRLKDMREVWVYPFELKEVRK